MCVLGWQADQVGGKHVQALRWQRASVDLKAPSCHPEPPCLLCFGWTGALQQITEGEPSSLPTGHLWSCPFSRGPSSQDDLLSRELLSGATASKLRVPTALGTSDPTPPCLLARTNPRLGVPMSTEPAVLCCGQETGRRTWRIFRN